MQKEKIAKLVKQTKPLELFVMQKSALHFQCKNLKIQPQHFLTSKTSKGLSENLKKVSWENSVFLTPLTVEDIWFLCDLYLR